MRERLTNGKRRRKTGKRHDRSMDRPSTETNPQDEKVIEKLELSDLDRVMGGWGQAA